MHALKIGNNMKKKYFWLIAIVMVLIFLLIPVGHILRTQSNETGHKNEIPKGYRQ